MRLKTLQSSAPKHSDMVCAVGWSTSDEMISASDDHTVLKWNLSTMDTTPITNLPSSLFPTSMNWFPRTLARNGNNDILALTATDGKLHFISRSGKTEKTVDAHRGAALVCRWSPDGTGLLTGGEDGTVKMWSRNGMLRSVITQMPSAISSVSWDGSAAKIMYTCGDSCYIKALKAQLNPIKWKSHDGLITCADWNAATDLIITGAEDCKFKVWDSFGRVLYASSPHDYPITSLAWTPDGNLFVVGSFNILRLCDKAGWSHSLEKLSTGSVFSVAWSPDGTQLVAGCAQGNVVHAHLVEKRVTYRNLEITQTKKNIVEVRDVSSDVAKEKLETRDRITRITVAHDHLVVVTTKQCYIYSSKNWNTPVIAELKEGSVSMLLQSDKLFLLADGSGLYTYNYDGRNLCEIKLPGSGGSFSEKTTSLSNDVAAIRDRTEFHKIHLLDPTTSKSQGDGAITHSQSILEVRVSQSGPLSERLIVFRDIGSNIFVALVNTFGSSPRVTKIGSQVEQLCFNDVTPMLSGLGDGKVVIWTNAAIAFTDRDLLTRTVIEKEIPHLGKFPYLLNFTNSRIIIRRSDGSLVPSTISPFPAALLSYVASSKWDQAIRLCRHIKDDVLWATLAGMAAHAKNLYAAEIAYGALDEGEKVVFLSEARAHPNKEVRAAMLSMFNGKISDADVTLERSGHIFRAIMLNISTFRWSRALELAVKHKSHVETVIGYREKYLESFGRKETDPKFLQMMSQVEIDWEQINETIAADKEKEER